MIEVHNNYTHTGLQILNEATLQRYRNFSNLAWRDKRSLIKPNVRCISIRNICLQKRKQLMHYIYDLRWIRFDKNGNLLESIVSSRRVEGVLLRRGRLGWTAESQLVALLHVRRVQMQRRLEVDGTPSFRRRTRRPEPIGQTAGRGRTNVKARS